MPNWVMNLVKVTSDTAKEMKVFKDRIQSEESKFDFNKIIPMPKEIKEAKDQSWYNWSIKNWGTKWNAHEIEIIEDRDTYIELSFMTAWSLPKPIYTKLAELFPNLKFEIIFAEENDPELSGVLYFSKNETLEYWSESEEDFEEFYIQAWGVAPDDKEVE